MKVDQNHKVSEVFDYEVLELHGAIAYPSNNASLQAMCPCIASPLRLQIASVCNMPVTICINQYL